MGDVRGDYGLDDLAADFDVSHETKVALKRYDETLLEWAGKMNLIARSTIEARWRRHFLDSAQLFPFVPKGAKRLIDLGSGAGFPGLVLAIMGAARGLEVHLVESTRKKARFLSEAARAAGVSVEIHADRAEALNIGKFDVVTARAVAPLEKLMPLAAPFATETTVGIFPKGRDIDVELTGAAKSWIISADRAPSRTDPEATILIVKGFRRVPRLQRR